MVYYDHTAEVLMEKFSGELQAVDVPVPFIVGNNDRLDAYGIVDTPVLWYRYGLQPDVSGFTFSRLEYVNTLSDPTWVQEKSVLQMVPRKSKIDLRVYLRKPVKPRYNPPRWRGLGKEPKLKPWVPYPFTPPSRLVSESDRSLVRRTLRARTRYINHIRLRRLQHEAAFQRRHMLWSQRKVAFLRRLSSYDSSFQRRILKYERRLAILERRTAIVKTWQHRRPLVFKRPHGLLPDHPYTRERIQALGSEPVTFVTAAISAMGYDGFWYPTLQSFGFPFDFPPPGQTEPGAAWHANWFQAIPNLTVEESIRTFVESLNSDVEKQLETEIADLDAKLLRKLHSKVALTEFHVAQFIAERAQTLGMLADLIKRLSDLATGRKRLVKAVSHFLRNPRLIANDFLAFKFGVEPLLRDMYALGEKIAELQTSSEEDVLSFRTNGRKNFSFERSFLDGTYRFSGTFEVSYTAKFGFSSFVARSLSGLGLVNPAEVAWELLPWSFVVDWALPVGQYLNSFDETVGLNFRTGTRKIRFVHTVEKVSNNPGFELLTRVTTDTRLRRGIFTGTFVRESKRRTVLTALPDIPSVVYVKDPFSLTHSLEGLALFVQRLFRS